MELARHNAAVLSLLITLYTTFCLKLVWSMKANVSDAQWKKRVAEKKGVSRKYLLQSLTIKSVEDIALHSDILALLSSTSH